MAAKHLTSEGHSVVLHARNVERGQEALRRVPEAENVLIGDLCKIEETKQLAAEVNKLGEFDAIIHNAGVYNASSEAIIKVNTLAPYILTCLINAPKRLIYLSSGMQSGGRSRLDRIGEFSGISYSDSKLHNVMLTMAVARLWPNVLVNAVDPGWVPTKMGGRNAPDDLVEGYMTQSWLATSDDANATVSGHFFYHRQSRPFNVEANDVNLQDEYLRVCENVTGVKFPVY